MASNSCCAFYQTLFTASKLGVFDVLSDSGLRVEEVANRIDASLLGTERLLDAAVSLGLLHKLKCEIEPGESWKTRLIINLKYIFCSWHMLY